MTATQTTLVPMDRTGVKPSDIYYTPGDAIRSLLDSDRAPPPRTVILEPCAGRGNIVEALRIRGHLVLAIEIRASEAKQLANAAGVGNYQIGDYLTIPSPPGLNVVTNPPFSLASQFWMKAQVGSPRYVAFLLRLNTLGSATWVDAWKLYPPTFIRSLIRRPSFTKTGKGTDAAEYAWVGFRRGDPPLDFKMV